MDSGLISAPLWSFAPVWSGTLFVEDLPGKRTRQFEKVTADPHREELYDLEEGTLHPLPYV
ncbi:MAG: hypothetical protein DRG73_10705 [Deltaproteobacteria bacterium]|nr:MAG: hypothetical protein DRG73_10705 [Deltaproteobacteria bacterium]